MFVATASKRYAHGVDLASAAGRPVPRPSALTQPFWDGCRAGLLLVQRCDTCGTHVFVPQDFCPSCLATDLTWVESAGEGHLVSYTVVWRPQTPAFEAPYVVAVVQLTEGHDMVTNIVDTDHADLRIGAPVRVAFREVASGTTLPCFTVVTA